MPRQRPITRRPASSSCQKSSNMSMERSRRALSSPGTPLGCTGIASEFHLAPWKQDFEFWKTWSAVFSPPSCSLKALLRDRCISRCLCPSVRPCATFLLVPVNTVAPPTSIAPSSPICAWFQAFRLASNLFIRPSARPPASTSTRGYRCLSVYRISCMSSNLFCPTTCVECGSG